MLDINNEHVFEKINSKIGKVIARKMLPLHFMQYEAIANYITEEPSIVTLCEKENDKTLELVQILRFRFWIPNKKIISWCVYSTARELNDKSKIVIRKIEWDREQDTSYYMTFPIEERGSLNKILPRVYSHTVYIDKDDKQRVIKDIENLDNMISSGVILSRINSKMRECDFDEIEIRRLYNWGSINSVWNVNEIGNKEVENLCEELSQKFMEYVTNSSEVYKIDLDYTYLINTYKQTIY